MSGIQLEIADDPGFQLVAAVRRYRGWLAFASKDLPGYATLLLRSPDWQPWGDGYTSIEEFFTIRIVEPERWPVIRRAEQANHVPSNALVYAIFPDNFRRQIDSAVQALLLSQNRGGRVSEVRISFSAENPAGFVVESVTVD
jgi:hypothetical protein